MIVNSSKNSGQIGFLLAALILLALGIALHLYNAYVNDSNGQLDQQYQLALEKHNKDNVYFLPSATIDWLKSRQNDAGYFVTNPDMINEPSQYNQNSLRATRYATATLKQLSGLATIDRQSSIDFILQRYHKFEDPAGNQLAGFSTLQNTEVGVRPTMDAILSLKFLSALDNKAIDIEAIRRFILSHQNSDGGFWDPHYPKFGKQSCIKCSSFALRALGHLNQHTGENFPAEFVNLVTDYINKNWDSEQQSFSPRIGVAANDSYDIFRAFIILWHLTNQDEDAKRKFVKQHFPLSKVHKTLREHFIAKDHAYSRKINSSKSSMKATHLMIWMYYQLGITDQLEQRALVNYVLSNQSSPGEYGGDIYNTYSATGILTKLGVGTQPQTAPLKPIYPHQPVAGLLPYLLYLFSFVALLLHLFNDKKQLVNQNILLEDKALKDPLTKLYNRDFLEKAYLYHSETDESLSLILVDIDFFKQVNDNYGHLTGDLVLQELSSLLKQNIRKSDVLVRWGGEEFAILCPATEAGPAKILAEKLRVIIHDHSFSSIGNLTCSFGLTSSNKNESMNTVFERADSALYESKGNGRDQLVFR